LCLFRVAQESLHNAVKYSGVAQFAVTLKMVASEIRLEVSDNGAGFDVEEATGNGLGLVSMQERVHFVQENFSWNRGLGRAPELS
jgi:signal transduction histidine kinase